MNPAAHQVYLNPALRSGLADVSPLAAHRLELVVGERERLVVAESVVAVSGPHLLGDAALLRKILTKRLLNDGSQRATLPGRLRTSPIAESALSCISVGVDPGRARENILSRSRRCSWSPTTNRADKSSTWNDRCMRARQGSYTAYSLGCAIVWAVIMAVLIASRSREKFRTVLPVFGGWWIGWTSATIARYVYPPPKSRPPWARDRRS